MAAIYPSGVKTFPTYANGDQVTPATINDPNLEITAIETGLRQGLAHDLVPDLTANHRSLGTAGAKWYDLYIEHNVNIEGTLVVTGGIQGDLAVGTLAVAGNAVIGGNVAIDGVLVVNNLTTLIADRPAGQSVLAVLNTNPAGLACVFRAAAGGGIIVQLQDSAAVPKFDLHADGSMNTAGNLTIAGDLSVGGSITFVGPQSFSQLTVTGPVVGGTTLTAVNSANVGLIVRANSGTGLVAEFQSAAGTPTHDFLANGNLNIAGAFTAPGTVTGGNLTTAGGLTAGGAVISGVLDVRSSIQSYLRTSIPVSTTPATIFTATRPHSPADPAGLVLVCGTGNGDATSQFVDVLLVMTDGFVTVISNHNKGAVQPHNYSWSGLDLQLTFTNSVVYLIHVLPVLVGGSAS